MSEYMFGLGKGHLSQKIAEIAEKHGAKLINYVDPGCSCGYGCSPDKDCPNNKRHWFTTQNLGEPFNSRTANAVLDAIK